MANSEDQPLEDIQTVMQLGKRSELITKICLFGLAPLAFVYTFAMILCSGRNWKGLLLALAVLAAVCGIGYIVVNGITTIRLGYRDADPWLVTIRVAVRSGIAWVLGAVIAAVMMLVKKNKVEQ